MKLQSYVRSIIIYFDSSLLFDVDLRKKGRTYMSITDSIIKDEMM